MSVDRNKLSVVICKKLHTSKKAASTLILYTTLVMYGVKDAYLVDCCNLTATEAQWLLDILQVNKVTVQLRVITVQSDVFIVNYPLLQQKLISIASCTDRELFVIIDLDREQVAESLIDYKDPLISLREFILDEVRLDHQIVEVHSCQHLISSLGGPFIAGFLLGYPCIYLSRPEIDTFDGSLSYATASSALSFQTLTKVSYQIKADVSTPVIEEDSLITVLEFTYPAIYSDRVRCVIEDANRRFVDGRCSDVPSDGILSMNVKERLVQTKNVTTGAISL